MFYNDDDDGGQNWKNSEVATLFVNNYLAPMLEKETAQVSADPQIEPVAEVVATLDNIGLDDVEAQFKTKVNGVISKLAELSKQYGNERIQYKIERAIMELEDIKLKGE